MEAERVARLEERVSSLKEDLGEIKDMMQKHSLEQQKLSAAVAKWKQGAGLIFALGAIGMWIIDHWSWLVSHFKS